MYDSTVGRWLSEDPIGFAARSLNLAAYVRNNPTNATDPTGLIDWKTIKPHPTDPDGRTVTLDDGKTKITVAKDPAGHYQCHSLTFGGHKAQGGPYIIGGNSVGDILRGDGWKHIPASLARPGDI